MNEQTNVQDLIPFLGVTRNEEGHLGPTVIGAVGATHSLLLPLFWPSIKEQEVLEQGRLSVTRIPQPRETDAGGASPSYDRYREAAGILPTILRLELRGPEDGRIGGAFSSLERDGDDVLLRLYMHTNDEDQPPGQDSPVTGLPTQIQQEVRERNLRVVATRITSADFQLLDCVHERILLHCALQGFRTLFVKMRGKDEGLDAGVREAIRRANPDAEGTGTAA